MFLSFCCASNWSAKVLIDDLIANGAPGSGCDIACLMPQLRNAVHFTLSAEFATVADVLSNDFTGLVRAFPHCRLPFPITWIELVHCDRPQFANAPMHAEEFQVRPKRVGYLLTATRDDLSAWKTHLFWSTEQGCSCASIAMNFDMTQSLDAIKQLPTIEEERQSRMNYRILKPDMAVHPGWIESKDTVRLAMIQHTHPVIPDYGVISPPAILREKLFEFYEIVNELGRADWAGEPSFLLAVIGLLNAKNAVETETVNYHKLNRARIKRGKLPLMEHKILKIARRQQQRVYGAVGTRGNYASMRAHFVRGHFKTRRTGIFFWHPHARGSFERGVIKKDYEVTR